eukprot:CAMPEP_0202107574 /NCGR_PEP_ID=MMETSP0965-20130614/16997_1 /ASSEMBLY_ACC=CAM_ASM_000507 /TAXON_ID=4773 /ORGANISM="Schizochytrium aggregatum, Strain ATCC28209" /LENGTH=32 /DNA_ID= /DNA_START= /DNA_END= /DNA_ORIENTATION=
MTLAAPAAADRERPEARAGQAGQANRNTCNSA